MSEVKNSNKVVKGTKTVKKTTETTTGDETVTIHDNKKSTNETTTSTPVVEGSNKPVKDDAVAKPKKSKPKTTENSKEPLPTDKKVELPVENTDGLKKKSKKKKDVKTEVQTSETKESSNDDTNTLTEGTEEKVPDTKGDVIGQMNEYEMFTSMLEGLIQKATDLKKSFNDDMSALKKKHNDEYTAIILSIKNIKVYANTNRKKIGKGKKHKNVDGKTSNNFTKQIPCKLVSTDLKNFMSLKDDEFVCKTQVVSAIHAYAKTHNLRDNNSKKIITFDATLKKLFPDIESLEFTTVMANLKNHFPSKEQLKEYTDALVSSSTTEEAQPQVEPSKE